MGCGASSGNAAAEPAPVQRGLSRSGSKKGDALYQTGGTKPADREEVRQNAASAAERRAEEQANRGVQGGKPTLSPVTVVENGGGKNEVVYSDAKTWN